MDNRWIAIVVVVQDVIARLAQLHIIIADLVTRLSRRAGGHFLFFWSLMWGGSNQGGIIFRGMVTIQPLTLFRMA